MPSAGEFSLGRFWYQCEDSSLTLGLTDRALTELGEVDSLDLPAIEESFAEGEVCLSVEGTEGKIELALPFTFTVSEINTAAKNNPEAVEDDPLGEGWLIKVEIDDESETQKLV